MHSQRLRNFILFLTFTILHFGATSFSIFLITHNKGLIIWLPSGCALAILVMFGLRFWPSIALGVLTAAILAGLPVVSAFGMVLAIVIAALTASYLLLRVNFCYTLEHSSDLLILLIVTLFYSAIGPFFALIGQSIGGLIPGSVFGEQWLIIWVGDITSVIVIVPALFVWKTPFRFEIRKSGWKLVEAGLLVVTLLILTLFFLSREYREIDDFYIFFPLLIWAGLRFGKRGATAAILLVVITITGISNSLSSIGLRQIKDLLSLEIAITTVAFMSLLLAVIVSERQQTQLKLKELNENLEQRVVERTHEVNKYIQRLKLFHEIDHEILGAKSLSQMLEGTLPSLRRLMNCQWAGIITFDLEIKNAKVLEIDVSDKIKWNSEPLLNTEIYEMPPELAQGKIYSLYDLQTTPKLTVFEKKLLADGLNTYLCVPLLIRENFLGAICFGAKEPGTFNQENIEIAQEVANEIAISIWQTHLSEEIRVGREKLRQLAQCVVSAQEEERRRLSRELHDEAGQALTVLKISLELITKELPAGLVSLRERLIETVTLTDTTMEQIRLLAKVLRPPALDTVGLNYAMEELCRDFARRANIAIDYQGENLTSVSDEVSICLYRILQEALTNVSKHAQAHRIMVTLQQEAKMIKLTIKDDGQGFQQSNQNPAMPTGIGLLGMKERLMMLGGNLVIRSQLRQGTELIACIPREGSDT